jgi:hypothetical protein
MEKAEGEDPVSGYAMPWLEGRGSPKVSFRDRWWDGVSAVTALTVWFACLHG